MEKNGFVLAPLATGLGKLSNESQEVVNVLSAAKFRLHLFQNPVNRLELYRAVDRGPFSLGWVGTHSSEKGFDLGEEVIEPIEFGRFLQQARTTDLVLNSCFSIEHVKAIQQVARVNIVATIDPDGVDDAEAWISGLYLARAIARTVDLLEAYQQTLAGGITQYQWFPYLSNKPPQLIVARRGKTRKTSGMSAGTVDELIRTKLNEHDVKLATLEVQLPATKEMLLEYIRDLREDVAELKTYYKPISALAAVPLPDNEDKVRSRLIIRILMAIAIFLGAIVLMFLVYVVVIIIGRIA